jgi:hypothetical protein
MDCGLPSLGSNLVTASATGASGKFSPKALVSSRFVSCYRFDEEDCTAFGSNARLGFNRHAG